MPNKSIKSKDRVKNFGEVFTPDWLVKDMCDMVDNNSEDDMFAIEKTFLEPCCGTGNFAVEIIERKLKQCKTIEDVRIAVGSYYSVEIQEDNVKECRDRIERLVWSYFLGADVRDILERNIVCGDFLNPEGIWFLEEYIEEFKKIRRKKQEKYKT